MTKQSQRLKNSHPVPLIWWLECDICHGRSDPAWTADALNLETFAVAGWRIQNEHPMDTCPACLSAAGLHAEQEAPAETDGLRAILDTQAETIQSLVSEDPGVNIDDLLERAGNREGLPASQLKYALSYADIMGMIKINFGTYTATPN
ncbi:hypothetical protein [Agromyces humi]|uniref:hypothetical protein n=1 Tax=Agromyces humi TaxID=1766800 RepID=UPI00135901A8|nr:hypothetical protein [Agromyces humi]